MNPCCPTALPSTPAATGHVSPARGLMASLGRLIRATRFASVDLTDAIFATMPRRDGAPREAVVRPNCSE